MTALTTPPLLTLEQQQSDGMLLTPPHLLGKQTAHVHLSVRLRGLLHAPGHGPPLVLVIELVAHLVLGRDRAPQLLVPHTHVHALALALPGDEDQLYIGLVAEAPTVVGQRGQRNAKVIAERMTMSLQTSAYAETGRRSPLDNVQDGGVYLARQQEVEVTVARARNAVPRLQNGQYIACQNRLATRRLKSHQLHPNG